MSTPARIAELPDVAPITEVVPGYEATAWFGIGAPRNAPSAIGDRLNKEINAALSEPTIKARLAGLGDAPRPGSAADFAKFIAAETDKWAKVAKFAGIKQS